MVVDFNKQIESVATPIGAMVTQVGGCFHVEFDLPLKISGLEYTLTVTGVLPSGSDSVRCTYVCRKVEHESFEWDKPQVKGTADIPKDKNHE